MAILPEITNEKKPVDKIKNAPIKKEQEKVKINGITIFKNTKCKTWYTRYRKDGKQYYISGKTQKEVSEKLRDALDIAKKQKVVGTTLQQWYQKWLVNGWKAANRTAIKNQDLWKAILKIHRHSIHNITIVHIKGHQGDRFNERADTLATSALGFIIFLSSK